MKFECLNCSCHGKYFHRAFFYNCPPHGETRFSFSDKATYARELLQCSLCGHFVSVHHIADKQIYAGEYVSATYGGDGIRRAFERITSLDPTQSDNVGRVRRVLAFAQTHLTAPARETRLPTVLDVGSGLCVFLHRMKAAGWDCTALDPDVRSVTHARERIGVKATCADFMAVSDLGAFDLITFNKVLEHVKDPTAMLAKSAAHLRVGGFVYVEVPDGEAAFQEGPNREEFFIEHHHVFSAASLALLAARAGFSVCALARGREPSTKYTLWAFMVPFPN